MRRNVLGVMLLVLVAQSQCAVPEDFPRFHVPGQEKTMQILRELYWLHYPGSGSKATLWDGWLVPPSLWPAQPAAQRKKFAAGWNRALSERKINPDGYVSTHQHASITHGDGWPFPMWTAAQRGHGWHFSYEETAPPPWRSDALSTQTGWILQNIADNGVNKYGWDMQLTEPGATLAFPTHDIETFQGPYIQIRWRAEGLGKAEPYLEWAASGADFSPERRIHFDAVDTTTTVHTMIPMHTHPEWKGTIDRLRIGFDNQTSGAHVMLQAIFTHYDTRHNINSQSYITGCSEYFSWTRDLAFLRSNIQRIRAAFQHLLVDHHAASEKIILTTWPGHDGRPGFTRNPDGSKTLHYGRAIGNNYWDLLPFGHKDCYATMRYYDTLLVMAELEEQILNHPEWNLPAGILKFDPAQLRADAVEVKRKGNELFWNAKNGRFNACIDADGNTYDYGFTFLNAETVYYDFATKDHADQILAWLNGERAVADDTSQTTDIYHWRFAPRATTKRNIDWYGWVWNLPESIPWGGQVQDGGAVLGFSYHDLMARLRARGPDNAWARLKEITAWFEEVQAAGGYRKYYDGVREGTLQGGGTAGGLGLDSEFFESVMVPQVMLHGFMGFQPHANGFTIDPRLPADWPELTIDNVQWQDNILSLRVTNTTIEITNHGRERTCEIRLSNDKWYVEPDAQFTRSVTQNRFVGPLKRRVVISMK